MIYSIQLLFSGIFTAVVKADSGYTIEATILTPTPHVNEPVDIKVSVLDNGVPLSDKLLELEVTYPDSSTQVMTGITDPSGIALFSFIASTRAENHEIRVNVSNNILVRTVLVQASDPVNPDPAASTDSLISYFIYIAAALVVLICGGFFAMMLLNR